MLGASMISLFPFTTALHMFYFLGQLLSQGALITSCKIEAYPNHTHQVEGR